jgi:hypothetical protein
MADQQRDQRNQDQKQRLEQDKQRVGQEREQRARLQEEQREAHRGTPTPTQEEADLLNLGHHVDLAKDGSEEDPNVGFTQRQLEGERGGDYKTRRSEPESSGSQHRPQPTQPQSHPSSQPRPTEHKS